MHKKIFGGIAIVAIAIAVAFNVSVSNQKQDAASLLALANVEALAQSEDGEDFLKVNCKITEECEEINYWHYTDHIDLKITNVIKQTLCIGTGSIGCTPNTEIKSTTDEFVACVH